MKFLSTFFYTIFIMILLFVAGMFLASMLPIPGNIEIKIVKSGSMEPVIPTGSLVVVKPEMLYEIGNVITFGADTKTEIPTTHRIISSRSENGQTFYTTKGDANEEADPQAIASRDVIGKVVLALPYAGFILDFARQPVGFALLIGVPAALIILEEAYAIFREARRLFRRREDGDDRGGGSAEPDTESLGASPRLVYLRKRAMDEIFVPMTMMIEVGRRRVRKHKDRYVVASVISVSLFISTLGVSETTATLSYFADIENSIGNIFRAGEWAPESPPPNDSDVVLNEFLPNPDTTANGLNFGDDNDSKPLGEWVELYNKGPVPVDVLNWYLADASGGAGNTQAVIGPSNTDTGSTVIPAGGWLVVYMNKTTLNNTGDEIHLFTDNDVEVDSVTYDDPSDFCENDPTPGNTNATTTPPSGTPGNGPNADCPQAQVSPNKSYARIPDGTGAWVDPIPTPGAPNIADEPAATQSSGSAIQETSAPATESEPQEEGDVLGASDVGSTEAAPDSTPEDSQVPEETTPTEDNQTDEASLQEPEPAPAPEPEPVPVEIPASEPPPAESTAESVPTSE